MRRVLFALAFLLAPISGHAQTLQGGGGGGGGGTGCVPSGGQTTNLIAYGVSGACAPLPDVNATLGALTLGASGTLGTITLGNATSGTIELTPTTGVLGTITITLPAISGVMTVLGNSVTGSGGTLVEATSPSIAGLTVTSSLTATGLVTLGDVATQATNTILANVTNATASPTAVAVSSCSAAGDALIWTTNTGPGCNTSITAAAAPVSGLTGAGTGVVTALGNAVNGTGGLVTSAQTYTGAIPVSWDSNTTVANATIPIWNPQLAGGGTITSVTYYTNGSGTPSFTADVKIGSTGVTSCSAISVSSATPATTTCTAANTFTSSSVLTLVISSASGTPNQALVQINYTATAN